MSKLPKTRKMYIQYFTGKSMRHITLMVPHYDDTEEVRDFEELLRNIATDVVCDFFIEGGTYEKKTP